MTSVEREEKEKVKKREKKLEDEEILQQATWVKYTIPIKHQVSLTVQQKQKQYFIVAGLDLQCVAVLQVWKQKGEEYRVTGYGGWSWVSKTRVPRFLPKLPGNTNANYRKELEGKPVTCNNNFVDIVFTLHTQSCSSSLVSFPPSRSQLNVQRKTLQLAQIHNKQKWRRRIWPTMRANQPRYPNAVCPEKSPNLSGRRRKTSSQRSSTRRMKKRRRRRRRREQQVTVSRTLQQEVKRKVSTTEGA